MFDISTYQSILASILASVAYSLIAWKLSGETFSETKFLRTTALSTLMALGFSVTGTPLGNVYVSPFAATLVSALGSKYLNTLSPATIQETQPIVDAALKIATPIAASQAATSLAQQQSTQVQNPPQATQQ